MPDPVVVSGAGPTGLMLAHELRLAGVATIVLERLQRPGQPPGQAMNTTAVELLDLRGLFEGLHTAAAELQGTHFSMLWLDKTPLAGRHREGVVLGQQHLERHLEDAATRLGADIRRGHVLLDLEQQVDSVTVTVEGPSGRYRIRAGYVVGADGEDSEVRALADIATVEGQQPCYGVVADVEVDPATLAEVHRGSRFSPAGGVYSGVPTEPGVFRVITAEFDKEPPGPEQPVSGEELRDSIHRLNGTEFPAAPTRWMRRYGGPTRVAEHLRKGRVFLAGDAAHTFFPLAGLRLSNCLQDAVNLGWKLAAEYHGWAPPGLLGTYHSERHREGARAGRAVEAQLALIHPAHKVAALRELVGELLRYPDANRLLLELSTGLDTNYGEGDGHPLVGRRIPYAALVSDRGPTEPARALRAARGVLINMTGGKAPLSAHDWMDRIDVLTTSPVGCLEAAAVLVRPDGHVAWARNAADGWAGLTDGLRRWFGEPLTA
ncbi:FAD-dependent monooxygenase [Streptomyces malaysiensis]|uniref:FAD-dependent monooxygenase n=1 Tax=Streptomyces malaysiensis subsp. samsunensis TaxID=459658 RepID=A0A9X2RYT8_STRMQ|nr:FAD-dependent monooxygenase [Streptomyces samsunensis]MCQ8835692.1 FAD-dependent monooxygenase [Streptomyces samsunensis]